MSTPAAIEPEVASATSAAPAARAVPRLSRWSRSGLLGLGVLAFWFFIAAAGPWLLPHSATDMGAAGVFEKVSLTHPFNHDYLGRDMLSRIMDGARYTSAWRSRRCWRARPPRWACWRR
jgi:peptide/nickel transport system permease protein